MDELRCRLRLVGERIEEIQNLFCERDILKLRVVLVLALNVDAMAFIRQREMQWHIGTMPGSLAALVAESAIWTLRDYPPNVLDVEIRPPSGMTFFHDVDWNHPCPSSPPSTGEVDVEEHRRFLRTREVWIRQRQVAIVIPSDDERWPTRTFMKVMDPASKGLPSSGSIRL